MRRKTPWTPPTRIPGTPAQEAARKTAYAALCQRWPDTSNSIRRAWLAEEMGIEERYAIVYDMDEVECATVVEICEEQPKKKRPPPHANEDGLSVTTNRRSRTVRARVAPSN